MKAKIKNKPEQIKLTTVQAQDLKTKILANTLSEPEKELFIGLLSSSLWLQSKLAASTITIFQLKQLFGITTEKKSL